MPMSIQKIKNLLRTETKNTWQKYSLAASPKIKVTSLYLIKVYLSLM